MPSNEISAKRSRKAFIASRDWQSSQKRRQTLAVQKAIGRAKSTSLHGDDKSAQSRQKKRPFLLPCMPTPTPRTLDPAVTRKAVLSAIRQVCATYRLPTHSAKDATALLLGEAASAPGGRRAKTTRAKTGQASPTIQWPRESFAHARDLHGENIVQFLRRVWTKAIAAGATRKDLRDHDPSAEMAISNYLRRTREFPKGRKLPPDIALPTKKEVNDRILASGNVPSSEVARLAAVAWRRQKAGAPGP
jgi:hypothetical protein